MKKIITLITSLCSILIGGVIVAVIVNNVIHNNSKGKFKTNLEFFEYAKFEEFYQENKKTYNDDYLLFDLSIVSGEHRYLIEGLDECHIHHNDTCKENDSSVYHFVLEAKYYEYIYVNENDIKFNIKITFGENISIDKNALEWEEDLTSSSTYNYILKSGDNTILQANFSQFRDYDEDNLKIVNQSIDNYLSSIKDAIKGVIWK